MTLKHWPHGRCASRHAPALTESGMRFRPCRRKLRGRGRVPFTAVCVYGRFLGVQMASRHRLLALQIEIDLSAGGGDSGLHSAGLWIKQLCRNFLLGSRRLWFVGLSLDAPVTTLEKSDSVFSGKTARILLGTERRRHAVVRSTCKHLAHRFVPSRSAFPHPVLRPAWRHSWERTALRPPGAGLRPE